MAALRIGILRVLHDKFFYHRFRIIGAGIIPESHTEHQQERHGVGRAEIRYKADQCTHQKANAGFLQANQGK